ncbi:methyltransferase domain-containing protein [Maridesulfovibrio salexigens]|uniref:Methyltransferase type 12 n=1 Tax=Maridesulfovibrio salexigens (strain ATCC 14822 / DSM 2638 / NCIMB 8403 / VKM B-1763) TaxID=526222 RepID=C6BU09_MARSD|nr:class I SAM-dependent methyltransferase [Maridesulfovibrio salexigens]ACS81718.1 Methyltransferase type 12 [Maridesulfovibrio salexigens DSM 2638]
MSNILNKFPKKRPPLSDEMQKIYHEHYKANREGDTAASFVATTLEKWMHIKIAELKTEGNILEIGAGTLNHIPYENNFTSYDIVEPYEGLYKGSGNLKHVRNIYSNINELPETQYDRILSVAAFEHICELPDLVSQCRNLLKPDGVLQVAIPSEGTPLWYLAQLIGTGLEFRLKYKLDYFELIRHEHVNTAKEITEVLSHYFNDIKIKTFGVCPYLSLYQYLECRNTPEN